MTVPAIDGWFTDSALLGTRCTSCGSYFFPPERAFCRNPACGSADLEETELSRNGKIWSFSINHYDAPAPFTGKAPYAVVAVELSKEQIVVLGQLSSTSDPSRLKIGDEVEISIEALSESAEEVVWKWKTT
jgi:uncharacterized OB-fold protein